jgi:hypothetical protein
MTYESTGLMEPMVPRNNPVLEDLVFTLTQKSSSLAGQVHPIIQESVGNLVLGWEWKS